MKPPQAQAAGPDSVLLPPEVAKKLGLAPGVKLDLVVENDRVELRPNIHSLAKVYVEPSSRCNLSCGTCIRQTWDEPLGDMSAAVFQRLLDDLRRFPHIESVMLGGFGEPTVHPSILEMIDGLKALGLRVEMVSNGTLLDEAMLGGLLRSRLDRLWVSFDGSEGPSYERIRKGARFASVFQSLKLLRDMRREGGHALKVGIAMVVMRDNIDDLKGIGKLARWIEADRVSVSNVIPYSPELDRQMVCDQALTLGTFAHVPERPQVDLPRLDANDTTKEPFWQLLTGAENISLLGRRFSARADECRFIKERCCFIRWDGAVAPCMGLLHDHVTYHQGYKRENRRHSFGDLSRSGLWDIWHAPDYAAFREKVAAFDFSPCHICGGCHLMDENAEDCTGNKFPTACGACLWAQGIIQCP